MDTRKPGAGLSEDEILRFYGENYAGYSLWTLEREAPELHGALEDSGLADEVPETWIDTGREELRRYFSRYFGGSGIGRTELFNRAPGFYHRLHESGLIEEFIPDTRAGRPGSLETYVEECIDMEWNEFYCKRIDLHKKLRKGGNLKKAFELYKEHHGL